MPSATAPAPRGARVVRGHDQRGRPQLREVTRELGFGVGGVQRNVDRAACDTQEADGGVGATRQRARHAIAAADAVVREAVPMLASRAGKSAKRSGSRPSSSNAATSAALPDSASNVDQSEGCGNRWRFVIP